MGRRELPKQGKLAVFKSFIIFNLAAVVGFLLGTVSFTASMLFFENPTFAFLFANAVGGLSHFGSNYVMQRQTTDKFAKNFFVFNATGIVGFLVSSAMFAIAILVIQDSNASWLLSCLVGTMSHFVLNDKAMKLSLK
jgi:MFS-type transporter involved in bile tolerance (Atg22 family)